MYPERGSNKREVGQLVLRWVAGLLLFGGGGAAAVGAYHTLHGDHVHAEADDGRYNSTSDAGYIRQKMAGATEFWNGIIGAEEGVALGLVGLASWAVVAPVRRLDEPYTTPALEPPTMGELR